MAVRKLENTEISERFFLCPICGGDHTTTFHLSSNGHKFSSEVRDLAREEAENVCAICGSENSFDVHHLLAIWAYKVISQEKGFHLLNKEVLTSVHNTLVVCEDCHDNLHYQDDVAMYDVQIKKERLQFYRWMARILLTMYYG